VYDIKGTTGVAMDRDDVGAFVRSGRCGREPVIDPPGVATAPVVSTT
jgi:hypothetical protein